MDVDDVPFMISGGGAGGGAGGVITFVVGFHSVTHQ